MPTSPALRVARVVVTGVLLFLLPGLSRLSFAQRPVAAMPVLGDTQFINASGRHIVASTPVRLVPDDTDDATDVYVFTVQGGTWRRLPRAGLTGVPDSERTQVVAPLSLSDDGRYLAFETIRASSGAGQESRLLARYDLVTGVRAVLRDAPTDPYRFPVMSRDGSTFAWIGDRNAVIIGRIGRTPLTVGEACPSGDTDCPSRPALTAVGDAVFYLRAGGGRWESEALDVVDLSTFVRRVYPEVRVPAWTPLATTASGSHVMWQGLPGRGRAVFELATRRLDEIPAPMFFGDPILALSDDADYVLGGQGIVYDRRATSFLASGGLTSRGLSADGRYIAVTLAGAVFALLDLDSDEDGMRDPWETMFQLDPTNPADAGLDADNDGRPNVEEFEARSHPRGAYRRYFAEGVSSPVFETRVSVPYRNPPGPIPAPLTVTFRGDDGSAATRTLGAGRGLIPDPEWVTPPATLRASQYAIEVESPFPIAVERETTWRTAGALRGAHATAGTTPSTTWYFAEGATTSGFQLFYLLANPGREDSLVTFTYLCAGHGAIARSHVVPAGRRLTVWANQEGGPLGAAECGARLEATHPVVAERSLYVAGAAGFGAGSASVGAHAPATVWRFAEGDTRPPFDTFLLLANPGAAAAQVTVRFLLPGGVTLTRAYGVPAYQRLTIWVDQEASALAGTELSLRVESSVPIVAERAIWWGAAGAAGWTESHVELGAAEQGTSWALASVPTGAVLTLLNDSDATGLVYVRLQMNGPGGGAERFLPLPPGRTTIVPALLWPALPPATYSAWLRSESPDGVAAPVPFVVERSSYAPDLSAGTSYVGTPVP